MKNVFRKVDEMKAMQWASGNDEEIAKFIGYRNKYPLYSDDGNQIRIETNSPRSRDGHLYVSLGDWIITHNGLVVDVVNDEKYNKNYVEI